MTTIARDRVCYAMSAGNEPVLRVAAGEKICVQTEDCYSGNDEHMMLIGSAKGLDECERIVLAKAHRFLTENVGIGANDAARLMSLCGELRVCQVADPLKTMKFMLPKAVLANLGRTSRREC